MCLDTLWPKAKLKALQAREPIKAYKVVIKGANHLQAEFPHGKPRQRIFKTGYRVNSARQKRTGSGMWHDPKYERGFHAYLTRKAAEVTYDYSPRVTIPVLMWDIVAAGKQHGANVVVARKMILLTDY